MHFIIENREETLEFLKKYEIDMDKDFDDVQELKNQVLGKLYTDAKTCLSSATIGKYKRVINSCGNNRKKMIKSAVLSFGNAVRKGMMKTETDKAFPGIKEDRQIEEAKDEPYTFTLPLSVKHAAIEDIVHEFKFGGHVIKINTNKGQIVLDLTGKIATLELL